MVDGTVNRIFAEEVRKRMLEYYERKSLDNPSTLSETASMKARLKKTRITLAASTTFTTVGVVWVQLKHCARSSTRRTEHAL